MAIDRQLILTGKGLGKAIRKWAEEEAELTAELKVLRRMLPHARGETREKLKALVEQYLPGEATWLHEPSCVRKTSQDYSAEAQQLKSDAARCRALGRPDLARKSELEAVEKARLAERRRRKGY